MCSLGENPATGDPFTVENRFPELGFASVITPVGFQLARYRRQLAFPDWPKLETCIALLTSTEDPAVEIQSIWHLVIGTFSV
jgi:hypothetical protein